MAKTFLDLINSVSQKINGKPADTLSRPTKTEIGLAINEVEKQMVLDKPQYNFLRKTGKVNIYTKSKGTTVLPLQNTPGVAAGDGISTFDFPGKQTYVAVPYTPGDNQIFLPSAVDFQINTYVSTGKLNGQFEAFITKSVTGNTADPTQDPAEIKGFPDMENIVATADLVNVVNDIFDGAQPGIFQPYPNAYYQPTVHMVFQEANSVPVVAQNAYWIVIKFTSQYNNNVLSPNANARQMFFSFYNQQMNPTLTLGQSLTWAGSGYPSAIGLVNGIWNFTMTFQNCTFNMTNVSLPADCRMPIRIGLPGSNFLFLPVDASQAMFKQFSCPLYTFYESGIDAQNNKTVTFNMVYDYNVPPQYTVQNFTVPNTYFLYIDYIASAGQMVLDTDIAIVPQDYVEALIHGAMVQLYSDNNGLPYEPSTYEKKYMYTVDKMNSIVLPQRSVAIQINTGNYTSTMAAVRGSTNSNSLYNAYWPNSWAHIFFSALGTGVTSQG